MNKVLIKTSLLLLYCFNAFAEDYEFIYDSFSNAMNNKEVWYDTFENTNIKQSHTKLYDDDYKLKCHKYQDYIIMEYGFSGNCCGNLHQAIVFKYTQIEFMSFLKKWTSVCTKERFADEIKTFPFQTKVEEEPFAGYYSDINGEFREIFIKEGKIFLLFTDFDTFDNLSMNILTIDSYGKISHKRHEFATTTKNMQKYANLPTEFCYASTAAADIEISPEYPIDPLHGIYTIRTGENKLSDVIKKLNECQPEELNSGDPISQKSEIECLNFSTNKIRKTGKKTCFYKQ